MCTVSLALIVIPLLGIFVVLHWWGGEITYELRRRNELLKEQNKILKENKNE